MLHFASHCHVAQISEDLVVLDAERGVYICLPGMADALRGTPDRPSIVECPRTGELEKAGLLSTVQSGLRTPPPSRPSSALPPGNAYKRRPRLSADWDLLSVYLATTWTFRARSFGSIVRRAGRRMSDAAPPIRSLHEDVAAFDAWLPWIPFQGECLLRSFMLLEFLATRGHRVQWVFGVATWPFAAHCWLQAGDVALNEHPGRLSRYTPILAVGQP